MPKPKGKLDQLLAQLRSSNKAALIIGAAIVAVIFSVHLLHLKAEHSHSSIATPSDICASKNTTTFTCYNKELNDLVNANGPEAAFSLLRQQYQKVSYVKSQCHQLVHAVGRASLSRYDYDLGQVYAHGDHFCASGYFHGASEQIVKDKGANYIINNAQSACRVFADKDRYSLDHYNCVHGIGHGLMEATEHELFESINICEAFTDAWEMRSCDSGVFMQNIIIAQSPDESADHTSKYLKKTDPIYPCNVVEEKHQWGCYIIQSSWVLSQVNYDYGKVFSMCTKVENAELRNTCYQSLGRDASGMQRYDIEKTKQACMLGKNYEAESNCVIGAARDFVYNYHGDKEGYKFCEALESSLQESCRSAVAEYKAQF